MVKWKFYRNKLSKVFVYLHSIQLAIPKTKIISLCFISLVAWGLRWRFLPRGGKNITRISKDVAKYKIQLPWKNSILENLLSFAYPRQFPSFSSSFCTTRRQLKSRSKISREFFIIPIVGWWIYGSKHLSSFCFVSWINCTASWGRTKGKRTSVLNGACFLSHTGHLLRNFDVCHWRRRKSMQQQLNASVSECIKATIITRRWSANAKWGRKTKKCAP